MKLWNKVFLFLKVLMLAVFLPVLFCVIFIGNRMDYYEGLKLETLRPNAVLFLIALAGMAACGILFWICRDYRKTDLTWKVNLIVDGVMAALFVGLFFVSVRIAREIAFRLPWDIEMVRGVAYYVASERELGYYAYLSVYPNNIPISYILGRIYRVVLESGDYPYVLDFIWLQVNCVLISLGGFFSCLTVKKMTQKLMPTIAAFFVYLVLVGVSPWMMAAYTDTFGVVFPIMTIYFYISYRKAEKPVVKCVLIFLALLCGMAGGFVKPNLYIMVLAVLGTEFIMLLADYKKIWKYVLLEMILAAAMLFLVKLYTNNIIDEIGLDYNPAVSAGWQEYLLMGSNEENTGSYNPDDAGIFGEFQTSSSDRKRVAIERTLDRMKDRGFFGSIYFWLKKMVMTFNDGTFGWRTEVWVGEYYPAHLASNTALTGWLRSIYWSGKNTGRYNTICQLVWIFCILGIPGICLGKAEGREKYAVFVVGFLGIFFYQMLFEARARYLFAFLPFLIAVSICGISEYVSFVMGLWQRRRENFRGKSLQRTESEEE